MNGYTDVVYANIETILGMLDQEYVAKIPSQFRNIIRNNAGSAVSTINTAIPIDEQEIDSKTKAMLAVINYNFWCDQEQRKEYENLYYENQVKKDEEIRQKYDPANMFKNVKEETVTAVPQTEVTDVQDYNFTQDSTEPEMIQDNSINNMNMAPGSVASNGNQSNPTINTIAMIQQNAQTAETPEAPFVGADTSMVEVQKETIFTKIKKVFATVFKKTNY